MRFGIFSLFESFNGDKTGALHNQILLVAEAERLGFDEAWFGEHHFNDFSICSSPSVLLAYAFAKTTRIRLGCAGFLAPFYEPIRLAEEIASLDHLSGGRFNLGFAKGAFAPDSKHFAVTVEHLKEVMIENIKAITTLLQSTAPISFEGEFVRFCEVDIEPKPLQSPIPTYIATFASPQTVEFAAQNGYGLMFSQGMDLDRCEEVSATYQEIAGVAPKIVLMRTFCVANTTIEAITQARPAIDHFVKSMRAASSFQKSPTFDKARYATLSNQREAFFDGKNFLDAGIIGDRTQCIAHLKAIKERFSDVTVALKPTGVDIDTNLLLLKKFAEEIRPYV